MYIIKLILIVLVLMIGILFALMALWYLTRSKLQREYLKGIIKQAFILPSRYSV